MKINGNTIKVLLAFVVIAGVVFWAFSATRSHSYSGANLSFNADGQSVTANPSDEAVPVQLLSSGTRLFRVASDIEEVSGSATREGSGSSRTYQFDFMLPPGTSELLISGGSGVVFTADTDVELQATVLPMDADAQRTTILAAIAVILAALFYASNATEHQWINILRGKGSAEQTAAANPKPADEGGQGGAARAYGDNRLE